MRFVLFFIFLVAQAYGQVNKPNFACRALPEAHESLEVLLPANYSAVVRFTDWDKQATALVYETLFSEQLWVKKRFNEGTTNVGIGKLNVTFNGTKCETFSNSSTVHPVYGMHDVSAKALDFRGFSISQLLESIRSKSKNFTKAGFGNDTIEVGGIEAVRWIGCNPMEEHNLTLQVEVVYAGAKSFKPYTPSVHNPLLLSVRVILFNVTNATYEEVVSQTSFDIVELEATTSSKNEVPFGLFCSGMPTTTIPPTFPPKFKASFTYGGVDDKIMREVEVYYDSVERIASFRVNGKKDEEVPFLGNVSAMKDREHVTFIHDFTYGLEYELDNDKDTCVSVGGINPAFGDVRQISNQTNVIEMNSGDELLLNLTRSLFYFGGQRKLEGVLLDVYVSESASSSGRSVVELLYFVDGVDLGAKGMLQSIVQYHKDSFGNEVGRTVIRLNTFHNMSQPLTHTVPVSVQPCLQLVQNSSVYVAIKGTSMKNLAEIGFSRVKTALRETIASNADVSILRVDDIFFKENKEDVLALFLMGDASGKTPAETKDRKNETDIQDSLAAFNVTLSKQDLPFEILGSDSKTVLRISQSTLRVIPENWSPVPAPSFTGYTGGSMFVLAVFMLLLGAAIGVGILLFLWKRQRIGTLAYQVFE